ncbi:MAG TPA: hypothetical protein VIC08_01790 [Cellvibrionaceae bacterium]
MKSLLKKTGLTSIALVALLGVSHTASAWTAYQLHHNYYAIVCADGAIFSYGGSADGLNIVGPALCEGHGGIVGNPGGVDIKPATKDIQKKAQTGQIKRKPIDKASPKLMQ